MLRLLGRDFPIVLSRGLPEWVRRIAALYAGEAETVWYDPAREVVRAPAVIVPAIMHIDPYLHPALNLAADNRMRHAGAVSGLHGAIA